MQGTPTDRRPVLGDTLLPYVLELRRELRPPAFAHLGPYRRTRWSRGEVLGAALGVARWLQEAGVEAGDRVVLQGANSPAWVAAFYGCVIRGAVAVPLEPGLEPTVAAGLAERTGPRAGLGDADSFPMDAMPWLCLRDVAPSSLPPERGTGSFLERAGLAVPDRRPEDPVQIVFTSGTTGRPRAVPITHRNLLAAIHPIERGYRKKRRQQLVAVLRPRLLCLVPPSHLFGQVVGIHLPALMGLPVVFPEDLRPRAIREVIKREKITVAVAVPRILALLQQDLIREGIAPHDGDTRTTPAAVVDKAGAGQREPEVAVPESPRNPWVAWLRKAWRGRRVRRHLGWRFAAWISGGAALDEGVEEFWDRLGYFVVQGYGLTETAPIISVSNPFARRRGSVGRPLSGQEIRVGSDGELWVRGENVASGYLDDPEASAEMFRDGWLRTGDRVDRDEKGRLYVRGRLKDVIVTADGTNVDPALVEKALEATPGVAEAACVGKPGPRGEEIHAVLVLTAGGGPGDIEATAPSSETSSALSVAAAAVRGANERLPAGQRLQSHTVWHEPSLPRTSLGKLKRAAIRERLARGRLTTDTAEPGSLADPVAEALARLTGREPGALDGEIDLDRDLGLSSLDRLDLMVKLEETTGRTLDEPAVAGARTLTDLRQAMERPPSTPIPMPRWARGRSARLARAAGRTLLVAPLFYTLFRLKVEGREKIEGMRPPFLLVANHLSHLDTAAILFSLPHHLRRHVAVAMATEHFSALFRNVAGRPDTFRHEGQDRQARGSGKEGLSGQSECSGREAGSREEGRPGQYVSPDRDAAWEVQERSHHREPLGQRLAYGAAVTLFHAYPLPRGGGFSGTLAYTAELVEAGYCPLIFPEGRLKRPDEAPPRFREGPAMLAIKLGLPVIPIGIDGSGERLPPGTRIPRPGTLHVRFGAPLQASEMERQGEEAGEDDRVSRLTVRLERAVRALTGSKASRRNESTAR